MNVKIGQLYKTECGANMLLIVIIEVNERGIRYKAIKPCPCLQQDQIVYVPNWIGAAFKLTCWTRENL